MGSPENKKGSEKEEAKVWQSNDFGQIECLRANYLTHSFARHTHEGFAIGVIERGIEIFNYQGRRYRAGEGQIILINPAEVHDGNGEGRDGWAFSIFYVDPKIMHRAAMEMAGGKSPMPFFREAVIEDAVSAHRLLRLHRSLETSDSALEKESLILSTFAGLISRQSPETPAAKPTKGEPRVVSRVKSYLEENYMENVSLAEIAAFARMSRFHLIRVFKKHTGLPPHAYLEQIRVNRAKELLRSGTSIIETANELGFFDQSHLTKTFKRFAGTTPGQYLQGNL
ncbi:MAG: AraC family transcriptional regulator [Pyrinomonadaceae bacterium]